MARADARFVLDPAIADFRSRQRTSWPPDWPTCTRLQPIKARAIHIIAISRLRHDTAGRVYYDRKVAEGKTSKEAIRALKRQLSDVGPGAYGDSNSSPSARTSVCGPMSAPKPAGERQIGRTSREGHGGWVSTRRHLPAVRAE